MMNNNPAILVTGASGGIGRAAAIECARKGARIAVHYNRNRQLAEQTFSLMEGEGHVLYQADVTDPGQVKKLIDSVDDEMGGIDVLVNNAGVSQRHDITEIDYDTWQESWKRIVDTNLTGPSNLSYCAIHKMVKRSSGGRIVNVSSRGAFRGEPQMPWYGASKAGMNAMGQSLAQALGPKNVFIYTVAPGFVETEMAAKILASPEGEGIRNQSTIGRVAQPEELGRTIGFLALEAPEFMTGCIIDINGASYLRS
jgi:NAD(P)-dependent dehydrogenase (short-subunit alcohol dehydrogenase family)